MPVQALPAVSVNGAAADLMDIDSISQKCVAAKGIRPVDLQLCFLLEVGDARANGRAVPNGAGGGVGGEIFASLILWRKLCGQILKLIHALSPPQFITCVLASQKKL